jgi:hypothetical protein
MIDTSTDKPLCVSIDGSAWPYIMVPFVQLDKVKTLFDANKLSYWVDEEVLSLDEGPEIAFINFRHGSDPVRIQNLLDSIP